MDGRLPLTIVRPAAVFGPRDKDLFTYFELVNRRLSLKLGRKERRICMIYVLDLVRLAAMALHSEDAIGQTYNACTLSTSYSEFSEVIARALDRTTLSITLPEAVLTPMSLWARVQARITSRPALLNDQRIIDMREHYWLCSGDKATDELGFQAEYFLDAGVRETAAWYRENGWL
jgi:nucleoside-diphosphate-sugar epimerase